MREERIIASKLFVGNLNYQTTQKGLQELFGQVGEVVDVFMPSDRNTGKPRGFAFVEFAQESDALEAIEKLNEYSYDGRNLRVNMAEEKRPRAPRPFVPSFSNDSGGGRGGGSSNDPFKKAPKPKGSRRNSRAKKRSL